jgi:hypothetical protein
MKSWQSMYNLMDWYDHLERLAAIEAKKNIFVCLKIRSSKQENSDRTLAEQMSPAPAQSTLKSGAANLGKIHRGKR